MSSKQIHFVSNVTFGGGEKSLFGMARGVEDKASFYLLRRTKEDPKIANVINNSWIRSKHSYSSFDQVVNLIYAPAFVLYILSRNSKKISGVDIVFHGFPFQFVLPLIGFFFKSVGSVNFVYHQNKKLCSKINYLVGYTETFILKNCKSNVYAVSDFSRNLLKEYLGYFGVQNIPVKIFRNTILPLDFQSMTDQCYKKTQDKIKGKMVFAYPARFHKEKRHERIIELAGRMLEHKDIIFLLLGDGPEFGHIQEQIKKQKLSNILMLGSIPSECMNAFYEISSGIIFPSASESFGLVFYESLYHKKPVFVWEKDLLGLRHMFDIKNIKAFISGNLHLDIDDSYVNSILSMHTPESSFNSIYNSNENRS